MTCSADQPPDMLLEWQATTEDPWWYDGMRAMIAIPKWSPLDGWNYVTETVEFFGGVPHTEQGRWDGKLEDVEWYRIQ